MPKGGFLGTPPKKTIFPVEFSDKNCTIDRVRQIMHICEKKKFKKLYRFKMAAILPIFISRDCAIPQNLKNRFPEGIFEQKLAQISRP